MPSKTALVIVISIIAAAGILLTPMLFSLIGFTTLSLSQATFDTDGTTLPDGSFFSGKLWILQVAQGGLAQRAVGTLSPNDIGAKSGETPEKEFGIEMNFDKQTCDYAIVKNSGAPHIYEFRVGAWDTAVSGYEVPGTEIITKATREEACPNNVWMEGHTSPVSSLFWCIEKIPYTGAIAYNTIENPYVRTISTITVGTTDNPTSDFMYIDTKKAGNIRGFVNPNVYVSWEGNLVRSSCPSQADVFAYYDGSWKTGSTTFYETYKNSMEDLRFDITSKCGNFLCPIDQFLPFVERVNANAVGAMTYEAFGTITDSIKLDGAVIEHELQSPVQIPVYVFYVKADYLGIVQPNPNIRIVSIDSPEFRTNGYADVTIRNDGDDGNAEVSVNCPAPFNSGPSQIIGVRKGEQKTLRVSLLADTDKPITVTCTATANDGLHIVTSNFQAKASNEIVCEPGAKVCTPQNEIKQCNQYGSSWELIQTCASDEVCTYENQQPVCKKKDVPACQTDTDCDDNDPTTIDKCEHGLLGNYCTHEKAPLPLIEISLALIVLLSTLLTYAVKREALWAVIGLVVGVLGAIIIWVIYEFVVKNWLLLLIGGAVGGTLFILLGGGSLVMILLAFLFSRRSE